MATKNISDTHIDDIELNHHIQRKILNSFQHQDICSYSDLLIEGMSGNSFIYHLKALIRQKLIIKSGQHSYELTALGKLTLDTISFETHRLRLRPVTGVLLAATAKDGQYMLYKSARQPFIGKSGFVFGKSRIGDNFSDIIKRMTSRRNITKFTIAHSKPISIIYRTKGEIISHRIGLLVVIDTPVRTDERTTGAGTTYWSSLKDFSDILPEVNLITSEQINSLDYIELDSEV